MSTVNGKGGLEPVGALGQAGMVHRTREYPIASGYATSIFRGDLVVLSSGTITRATQAGFAAGGALGVFQGCHYTDPNTGQMKWTQTWTASVVASDAQAMIADDPEQVFLVQLDAAATATAIGKNANLVQTSAGTALSGRAGSNLQTSTLATTNTLNFRVIGILNAPDNAITDTFPKVLVVFNSGMHFYRQATGV